MNHDKLMYELLRLLVWAYGDAFLLWLPGNIQTVSANHIKEAMMLYISTDSTKTYNEQTSNPHLVCPVHWSLLEFYTAFPSLHNVRHLFAISLPIDFPNQSVRLIYPIDSFSIQSSP